jgi:hypothetical protein
MCPEVKDERFVEHCNADDDVNRIEIIPETQDG